MTQQKSIVELFDEAAQQMAAAAATGAEKEMTEMVFKKPTLDVDFTGLAKEWQGRELVTVNFQIGVATQTKKAPIREMVTSPYGGIFNYNGAVSIAGRPVGINGIAGAAVMVSMPGGEELFLETYTEENPLVVQSCKIANRSAWKQIHRASKTESNYAPQLVVVGAFTEYKKGLLQTIKGGSGDSSYEYTAICIAFEVVEWGIAFQGDEFWIAPPVESTFIDGLKVVATQRETSKAGHSVFGALSRANKARAAIQAATNPAAKLIVANNPVTEAKLTAELDAEAPVNKVKAKTKKTVKAKAYEAIEQQLDASGDLVPFAVKEDEEGMF